MTAADTLPAIDDCIDLYVQVHSLYGEDTFEPEGLSRRSSTRDDWTDLPTDVDSLTRLLNLLTAYGLLDSRRDGRYRVRCAPNENLECWRSKAATRVESLYERVHRTNSSRDASIATAGPETFYHGDEPFASVRVTDSADFKTVQTSIRAAVGERPDCAGIVLRSPGELAAEIQRFADVLCESEPTTGGERAFEKVTTDLVGDDKNDLEFRLFLREAT